MACDQGKDQTEFIQVVAWDRLAEVTANNLQKGRLVYVEGRLQQREYDKQDGSKGQATEIIAGTVRFLDFRKDGPTDPPLPSDPD